MGLDGSSWVRYGPRPGVEKEAHDAYRVGLNAQTSGDLQMAVRSTLGRREEKSIEMWSDV